MRYSRGGGVIHTSPAYVISVGDTVQQLMKAGANDRLANNSEYLPKHFAAKFYRALSDARFPSKDGFLNESGCSF